PVDEQRVVRLAWCLGDGVRRRGGELVRLADDEGLKRVALVERRRRHAEPVRRGGCFAWRHKEGHLRSLLAILLNAEHDAGGSPEDALRGTREDAGVLRLIPLDGKLIRCAEDQPPVVERDRLGWLEPR